MILIYLSSGLFLGWSLGANDASNIFGTAVGTKMVRFKTAAIIASIFVIIGAVLSGTGASHTLGTLGSVNALGGAFMVALAAGMSVFWMTKMQIPVSTSQAIVGAIIGWNFFANMLTNYNSLIKIVFSWVISPVLAAIFSMLLYIFVKKLLQYLSISIFRLDIFTRAGLIIVGAFGAYSLGANNIANVMGVFIPSSPFHTINLGFIRIGNTEILFFLGGIAIAVGIFTYSHKVMKTVGNQLVKLTPQSALIVVLAESLVLFLFASQTVHQWLVAHNLPAFPLVPISSSQLVVGGVIGIGLIQGGQHIKYRIVGKIITGWVTTPVLACLLTFISLFFLQNIFEMEVYHPVDYQFNPAVTKKLESKGIKIPQSADRLHFRNSRQVKQFVDTCNQISSDSIHTLLEYSRQDSIYIDPHKFPHFKDEVADWFKPGEIKALLKLKNNRYTYKWRLREEYLKSLNISSQNTESSHLGSKLDYIYQYFSLKEY